jgi:hypothetical protein
MTKSRLAEVQKDMVGILHQLKNKRVYNQHQSDTKTTALLNEQELYDPFDQVINKEQYNKTTSYPNEPLFLEGDRVLG